MRHIRGVGFAHDGVDKGKDQREVEAIFDRFQLMVTGKQQEPANLDLGKLAVLSGVREFPARVKCATLCWHTMMSAIHRSTLPS